MPKHEICKGWDSLDVINAIRGALSEADHSLDPQVITECFARIVIYGLNGIEIMGWTPYEYVNQVRVRMENEE